MFIMHQIMITATHVYDPLPNSIDIGPISIPLYGLLIMIGVVIALMMGIREGLKVGFDMNTILDGFLIILPLSLLGTRLWYVIFEWHQFADYPLRIIGFEPDGSFSGFQGLAIHGGIVTAFVSTIIYGKIKKQDAIKSFDIIAPGFMVAQSLGRWGNFFNQEAHGGVIGGVTEGVANLSLDAQRSFLSGTLKIPNFIVNNMYFRSDYIAYYYHHPTFLYESLWNLVGFILVLVLRRTKFVRSLDLFAFYLIWYSVARFFIEYMRTDALYFFNTSIRTAQLTSVLLILLGVVVIVLNHTVIKRPYYYALLETTNKAS